MLDSEEQLLGLISILSRPEIKGGKTENRTPNRDEEEPPELELGDAGDLLGDGVAAAGQDAGGDGLGAQRVGQQLPHVRLPRHRHHLRHLL